MENLFDYYKKEIDESKAPGYLLAQMYCEMFGIQYNKLYSSRFGGLVKLYGRDSVFRALVDISLKTDLNHDDIGKLIAYICKRYRDEKPKIVDLSTEVETREERIRNLKPLEIRSPFDE